MIEQFVAVAVSGGILGISLGLGLISVRSILSRLIARVR